MAEKKSYMQEFTKGIIKENPVLCLILGTCPTLAVTTSASNAIGMGVAATAVLICSNAVISALRKVIPDKVRIPAYITIIAGFVTVVQMLVKAFAPAINDSLGIFLPLIVVNCIIHKQLAVKGFFHNFCPKSFTLFNKNRVAVKCACNFHKAGIHHICGIVYVPHPLVCL